MPTNRYFDNYSAANEQALLDDLMVEVIQVHGIDAWYIPRQINNQDELFGEDASTASPVTAICCPSLAWKSATQ